MNLRPLIDPSVLTASVVYGILLRIAVAAGLYGVVLGVIVAAALWRYGYQVLREVAHGRAAPETVSAFNSIPLVLHFLFFALLIFLLGTTPLLRGSTVGNAVRWIAFAAAISGFPASAALMGITNSLVAAFNPVRILAVIKVLGRHYWRLLGACVLLTLVTAATESQLGRGGGILALVGFCVSTWGLLGLFALVGATIREHGDDFDLEGEPERREQRQALDRERDWQQSLDRAYASIRSGLLAEGYATIRDLARSERDSLEIYHWLFNRMMTWEDRSHALALATRFVDRLLASGRESSALDLAEQCRRASPAFSLPAETAAKLAAYARGIGRRGLADDLDALGHR